MESVSKETTVSNDVPVNGKHAPAGSDDPTEREPSDEPFLKELGLVGLEALELPILCTLVTGDPLLMVGEHGTAKTALAGAVAEAMGLRFHAYDASKALFEDIIGFPNPEGLGRGELDYVPTPLSLWDKEFILVDEISRANAQTQSKWLEVIRSRKVMGEELPDLKYVFSAMNPPGEYEGARPLDPALAGRFAFVLEVPSVKQMKEADRRDVLEAVGKDDAPLAGDLFERTCGQNGRVDPKERIRSIRSKVPHTREQYGEMVSQYLGAFVEALPPGEEHRHLDGRRLGMIRRNVLVALAVRCPDSDEERAGVMKKILFGSLPHPALGVEWPEHRYQLAHRDAVGSVMDHETTGGDHKISGQVLLNQALETDSPREAMSDLAALSRVFGAYTDPDSNIEVSSEVVGRIISTGRSVLDVCDQIPGQRDAMRAMTTAGTPARSKAVILLGWWLAEKNEEGSYRLNSNQVEDVPGFVTTLESKIKQLTEEEFE